MSIEALKAAAAVDPAEAAMAEKLQKVLACKPSGDTATEFSRVLFNVTSQSVSAYASVLGAKVDDAMWSMAASLALTAHLSATDPAEFRTLCRLIGEHGMEMAANLIAQNEALRRCGS